LRAIDRREHERWARGGRETAQLPRQLHSYVAGDWYEAPDEGRPLPDAATGAEVAQLSERAVDAAAVLRHGREVGGPALRELTFHQRAGLIKSLCRLASRRPEVKWR
jgi:oxepin-CoA hydrolase/3-oxo-5,6-dehydrosuberyl-CoA semialdehyde dehydrogenase